MNLDDYKKKVILEKEVHPPDGYLDGLEDRVWSEISKNSAEPIKRRLWAGLSSIAAAVLVLVLITNGVHDEKPVDFSQLPIDHQMDYYLEQDDFFPEIDEEWVLDMEPDELVELLAMDNADDDVFDYLYKNVKR